ncbi:hypothetical protein GCM10009730_62640 [Streptomyces albidochromogenes]
MLATGVPVYDVRVRGYPPADPDREHVASTSMFRLENDAGEATGVVAAAVDITQREHARERLGVLDHARGRIGPSLNPLQCAHDLAEITVPVLADVSAVALTDAVLRGADAETSLTDGQPQLRRAAAWPSGSGQVPAVGAAVDTASFTDVLGRTDPRIERTGANDDSLIVPLACRGVPLGVAWFGRPERRDAFEAEDVRLAMNLAAHTALCIDNARRYEHAHAVALALQGHLLQPSPTRQNAVDISHRYLPAGQGAGAWFDVLPLAGARVALVVGPVEGKGPETAAAMAQLRSAVYASSALDLDPHELVARLGDTVPRLKEERPSAAESDHLAVACVYAAHDPVTLECSIARAGRQGLLIAGPDGTWNDAPLPQTPALGQDGPPFATGEFSLPPGSTLLLLSGSLLRNADAGPLDRLRERLSGPSASSTDQTMERVLDTLPGDQPAVLVARTRALDPADVASWDIPLS